MTANRPTANRPTANRKDRDMSTGKLTAQGQARLRKLIKRINRLEQAQDADANTCEWGADQVAWANRRRHRHQTIQGYYAEIGTLVTEQDRAIALEERMTMSETAPLPRTDWADALQDAEQDRAKLEQIRALEDDADGLRQWQTDLDNMRFALNAQDGPEMLTGPAKVAAEHLRMASVAVGTIAFRSQLLADMMR